MNHSIFIANIEKETTENKFYRKVLYTSNNQQVVIMSIKPKEDIPIEIHQSNDQFARVEAGNGLLLIGPKQESKYEISDGVAFVVPSGTYHRIVNTSEDLDLKLYLVYSPPAHQPDEVQIDRPKQCEVAPMTGGNRGYFRKYQKWIQMF